jgi:DNA-binding NtrC family response regulator
MSDALQLGNPQTGLRWRNMRRTASSVREGSDSHTAASPGRRLRILVVDDEPLIRWSLAEMLTGDGNVVTTADSGAAALRAIASAEQRPDVVLLDYRMPDSDDLTLLTAIRRASPSSAVIMMTALSTPDMIEAALRLGVVRVLNKPFDMHDVPSLVRDVFDVFSSRAA